jgi:cyanate permease
MLANMPFLAGVLFGVLTGNLGDRYGIKMMVTIALVIFTIGAFARAFSTSFTMLMASSLVMGYGVAVLNSNSTKGIRLWFPGKSMGPAMGCYVCGASLGAGIALKVGLYFGTSSHAFMVCAIVSVAALLLWVLLYRTHSLERRSAVGNVGKGAFAAILRNKNVWLVSLMILFVFGNSTTVQTYMNAGLAVYSGGDVALIGNLALVSGIVVAFASIVMPVFIGKFKAFRPIMIVLCAIDAAFTVLVYVLPFGPLTFVVFIIQDLALGGILAMSKTVPALLPGIDPRNLGAVGGFQSTLQNIGAWIVAGYIIAPICQGIFPATVVSGTATYGSLFYLALYAGAGICTLLAAVCIFLLPKNLPASLPSDKRGAE